MKAKSFNLRVIDAVINNDGVRCNQGRVLRAVKRLQALESVLYCDSDLRGLSKPEKDFIKGNEYRCFYDCCGKRYYIFIARNLTTGKKQLYAYEKKQYLHLNQQDGAGVFNYEKWLLVNTRWEKISNFNYVRRFCCNHLAPIWIYE